MRVSLTMSVLKSVAGSSCSPSRAVPKFFDEYFIVYGGSQDLGGPRSSPFYLRWGLDTSICFGMMRGIGRELNFRLLLGVMLIADTDISCDRAAGGIEVASIKIIRTNNDY